MFWRLGNLIGCLQSNKKLTAGDILCLTHMENVFGDLSKLFKSMHSMDINNMTLVYSS